jgi:hypothetical protein
LARFIVEVRLVISLSIRRFRGARKQFAIPLAEDGMATGFPRALVRSG